MEVRIPLAMIPVVAALSAALISLPVAAETYTNEDGRRVECHQEQVKDDKGHPIAAPIAGAVIGGVVGNQFGSGTGKKLATGAGVAGGAYAGKKYNDNKTEDNGSTREVCRPVD